MSDRGIQPWTLLRRLLTWQRLLILVSIVVLALVFYPRVIENIYEIRSAAAIRTAEELAAAIDDMWSEEGPILEPGEEIQFFATNINELLLLQPVDARENAEEEDDPPVLGDYLDEDRLRHIHRLRGYGVDRDAYAFEVDLLGAFGPYRRCEITPEGIAWIGR